MKLAKLLPVLALLCAIAVPATAQASHFRYGQIAWEETSGTTVEFTVTTAWRVSPFVRLYFGDGGYSNHYQSGMTNLGTYTDLNGESYTVWRFTTSHTYSGDGPYTAQFNSCCRIGTLVNAAHGSFRVESDVDMRSGNTGGPVSAAPVLLQMIQGGFNDVALPIADVDSDNLTCRLSTYNESRISTQPTAGGNPLTVTSDCRLQWDTTYTSLAQHEDALGHAAVVRGPLEELAVQRRRPADAQVAGGGAAVQDDAASLDHLTGVQRGAGLGHQDRRARWGVDGRDGAVGAAARRDERGEQRDDRGAMAAGQGQPWPSQTPST